MTFNIVFKCKFCDRLLFPFKGSSAAPVPGVARGTVQATGEGMGAVRVSGMAPVAVPAPLFEFVNSMFAVLT